MTSPKAPLGSVAFLASRTAIDRCRDHPNCGPTVMEAAITTAIIAYPTLSRATKERLLTKPWSPPAARKIIR